MKTPHKSHTNCSVCSVTRLAVEPAAVHWAMVGITVLSLLATCCLGQEAVSSLQPPQPAAIMRQLGPSSIHPLQPAALTLASMRRWQQQIDLVISNENKLRNLVQHNPDPGCEECSGGDTTTESPTTTTESPTTDIPTTEYPGDESDDVFGETDYLKIAREILKKYSHLKKIPARKRFQSTLGRRNYLQEAEEILKDESDNSKAYAFTDDNLSKGSKDDIMQDDLKEILIENVKTKEGLKAIITELLKRRIENLKQ